MGFFFTITFSIQIQSKRLSWGKFETFSLFLPSCMQTRGMSFINPTLITVEIPISICIRNPSIINTNGYYTRLLWIFVLLILLITQFLLMISSINTITIFIFIVHELSSIFIYIILVLGFLAPLKSMRYYKIPKIIYLSSSRYIPLIWSSEWVIWSESF